MSPLLPAPEHLSPSQINQFWLCPMSWFLQRRVGLPFKAGWALIGGSALDTALNHHFEKKLKGESRGAMDTIDIYRSELERRAERDQPEGEQDYDYREAVPLGIADYFRGIEPHIDPVGVQEELSLVVGDVPMFGILDLRSRAGGHEVIIDNKLLSKRRIPEKEVKANIALKYYDLAAGDGSGHVQLAVIRKLKRCVVEVGNHFVTPADHAFLAHQAQVVWRFTQGTDDISDYAMADPSGWKCSRKWCSFWSQCRGSEKGVPDVSDLS